jgi:hypothetical protein
MISKQAPAIQTAPVDRVALVDEESEALKKRLQAAA